MKTFKLTVNEDELKALISHHAYKMFGDTTTADFGVNTSARIHDLTKRLNRDMPDIEKEVDNKQNYDEENKNPEVVNTSTVPGWN